jgi:hypothetical protein
MLCYSSIVLRFLSQSTMKFPDTQHGTLSHRQERALVNFAIRLGRAKFAEYRRLAKVGMVPIPRLSRGAAWRLMNTILQDLEVER